MHIIVMLRAYATMHTLVRARSMHNLHDRNAYYRLFTDFMLHTYYPRTYVICILASSTQEYE